MPTLNQLFGKSRKPRKYKDKRIALRQCPQRKAIVDKRFTLTPRKPNSAIRKVARVKIPYRRKGYATVTAYIPGIRGVDKDLQKHSVVLVRGGRVKDLPGVKYTIICGVYDMKPVYARRKSRSKYGVKRIK